MTKGDDPGRTPPDEQRAQRGAEANERLRESRESMVLVIAGDGTAWEESVLALPLGGGRFRLLESPLLSDSCRCGDTVHARLSADREWLVQSVVQRALVRSWTVFLSKLEATSQGLQDFLLEVEAQGGQWSIVFGGLLQVDLPQSSRLDCGFRLDKCLRARPEAAERAVPGMRRTLRTRIPR